jgi:hypothetical protein
MEKYCTAGQAADDNITRRIRIACWIPKATNTHSRYVIMITFSLQQWFQERTSLLRYTHIVLFGFNKNTFLKTARVMLLVVYIRSLLVTKLIYCNLNN